MDFNAILEARFSSFVLRSLIIPFIKTRSATSALDEDGKDTKPQNNKTSLCRILSSKVKNIP